MNRHQTNSQLRISIQDSSQIGEARRTAGRLAAIAAADEVQAGKYAIVITELATNLLKHAQGGDLLMQSLHLPSGPMLEVISVDKGPGIASVERCLTDGYSTGGTSGNGLGAVSRQSDEFDIYSVPGDGTVVLARVAVDGYRRKIAAPKQWPDAGMICIPYPGETECGDTWRIAHDGQRCTCMVADGLGHGPLAAQAAQAAAEAFENDPAGQPAAIMQRADLRMRETRGGAVAVCQVEYGKNLVRYCGIGNISGTLLSPDASRGLVSHNGIVGHNAHRIQETEYPWTEGSMLVMCSDGLQTRWRLSAYQGLRHRHPAVIAAVLFRDFQRGRDDVTVVLVSAPGGWTCTRN